MIVSDGDGRAAGLVVDDPGGDEPPFLWAHGLTSSIEAELTSGLFDWTQLTTTRVIRYDARGHGASHGTDDPATYTWPQLGADIIAILDALGVQRCAIGGASMGCATAIYAALRAPHRIERLVLATPPTAWRTRTSQRQVYERSAELILTGGMRALIDVAEHEHPPIVLGAASEQIRDDGLDRLSRMDPQILAAILRGAAASDLPPTTGLAALTQPTLVLAWTDDPGHPLETAEALTDHLPDATLRVANDLDNIHAWPQLVDQFLHAPRHHR